MTAKEPTSANPFPSPEATMALLKANTQHSAKPDPYEKRHWDLLNKAYSLLASTLRDRPAVGPLIAALKDQDRTMRAGAAAALGGFHRDTRAVKPLIASLDDPEWHVRAVAAWALGEIGPEAAIPALTELSKDKDSRVRKQAAEAIKKIRGR